MNIAHILKGSQDLVVNTKKNPERWEMDGFVTLTDFLNYTFRFPAFLQKLRSSKLEQEFEKNHRSFHL